MSRSRFIRACALAVLVASTALAAADVGQLATGIRQAADTSRALGNKPWNQKAEASLVDKIDRLTDSFHELAADGMDMPGTANALIDLMETTRSRYTDVLERMQADVIREDGDLEAVQDSSAWQERELLAMRLQYRLDWVLYETAMRYEHDTGRRKKFLQRALAGFADFLGSGDVGLTVESLLGRALTSKALKQYDSAIADLRAALAMRPDSGMSTRINVALAEAYLASGRLDEALQVTGQLVTRMAKPGSDATGTADQIRFLRAKSLLLALGRETSRPGGKTADRMRIEAAATLEQLYRRGPYWKSKVAQLVDAGIRDPSEWAEVPSSGFVSWLIADSLRRRGEYDDAAALYERLLSDDRFTADALFGLGFCHFYSGRYREAVDRLSAYLGVATSQDPNYANAAYLRFKAAESVYLQAEAAAKAEAATAYLSDLRDFLEKAPDHPNAFEAWFRLGDWQRDHQEYVACGESFGRVRGDAAFEIKASYLSAQCYVEDILARPDSAPASLEDVSRAVAALDTFASLAQSSEEGRHDDRNTLLAPLEAKAVVMSAAIVTRAGFGTMQDRLQRLDAFERRFPNERDLLPEVLSLRIVAYRTLAQMDQAGEALEALLALDVPGGHRVDSLKRLGIVFLKEASKRDAESDYEGALRSRRVALRVYEALLADAKSAPSPSEPLDGIERLVADLRSQTTAERSN